MIELKNDQLIFSFPDVHEEAVCAVTFQRTLRIPNDERCHSLPPSLGDFPLFHVEDFPEHLPNRLLQKGGVMLPMYQSEALWLDFDGTGYPFALKIAAGKVNALTGKRWSPSLSKSPQDYLVLPTQPWLDGFSVEKGVIRQFVAMPLGTGITVEEQITSNAEYGGLQIQAFPMKRNEYLRAKKTRARSCVLLSESFVPSMGLAPGGKMRQDLYEDEYGINTWDTTSTSRCFVHILNSTVWMGITGRRPPCEPASVEDYIKAGLPWFEYYDSDAQVLNGSSELAQLRSTQGRKSHSLNQNPLQPGPGRRRVTEGND